jgi:carbonic anhydrase
MEPSHDDVPGPMHPDEALRRLAEGNRRFTSGNSRHNLVTQERLASLASRQQPFAAILGCSDSRVPVELVFDQGFGDLFVLRLAGNIVSPGVLGSLQFAYLQLGITVLVVLGHEGCGAVRAALACKFHKQEHPEHIQALADSIAPGLVALDPDLPPDEQMRAAVEANVRWSIQQIVRTEEVKRSLLENRYIRIVGAVYELETGNVRWLDS